MALLLSGAGSAPALPAQQIQPSIGADLRGLRSLAKWSEQRDPRRLPIPELTCGVGAGTPHSRIRLDHEVSGSNDKANRHISDLDRRVVRYLADHHWTRMNVGEGGGIPDMKRCFQKDGSIIQIFKTTTRCTMNSPCAVYDGFAAVLYVLPERR